MRDLVVLAIDTIHVWQRRRLRQTHTDVVKEASSLKHTCVCSEERTVECRAVLMQTEVRAQWTSTLRECCRHWSSCR